MLKIKKEKIGWKINSNYYKLNSKFMSLFFYILDVFFSLFFFYKKKAKVPQVKKILVIRLEHIGDVVLTTSFIANLRKNYPNSEITFLCRKENLQIASMIEGIDTFVTLNPFWTSRSKNSDSFFSLVKFVFKNYNTYDLSFDLLFDFRNILLGNFISKFSVGSGVRGFGFLLNRNINYSSKPMHIIDRQLEMLKLLKLNVSYDKVPLKINGNEFNQLKKKLESLKLKENEFDIVQMSSGARAKEYSLNLWISLIKKELKKGKKIVTCDLDKTKVKYLQDNIQDENFIYLPLSLKEYIYLIKLSQKVYTVDTFVVHVASLFDKKIVAFYSGANLVSEWGPYLSHKNALVKQDTSCKLSPCGLTECIYGYPSKCMRK